jgi:hypothetical protein
MQPVQTATSWEPAWGVRNALGVCVICGAAAVAAGVAVWPAEGGCRVLVVVADSTAKGHCRRWGWGEQTCSRAVV